MNVSSSPRDGRVCSVRTDDVEPCDALAFWAERMRSIYFDFELDAFTEPFRARTEVWSLGHLGVGQIDAPALRLRRGPRHVSRLSYDGYFLMVPRQGTTAFTQGRECTTLEPGDLMLVDGRQPLDFVQPARFVHLALSMPVDTVKDLLGPAALARRLPAAAPLSRMLAACLAAVATDGAPLADGECGAVEEHLVSLLHSACVHRDLSGEPPRLAGEGRVLDVIRRHLGSPDLGLELVACEAGLSRRQVQKLFHRRGTTFSRFVRGARVERCVAMMRAGRHARRSITELAMDCGFDDLTTFSRAVKQVMGTTASTYRARLRP